MSKPDTVESADLWDYICRQFPEPEIQENLRLLSLHSPGVLASYFNMRIAAFDGPPEPALSHKHKELIILAIECVAGRKNPPPVLHARKAVEAGATLQEISEVMGLCIMLAGMITYQESGQFVLKAAEEHLARLDGSGS